VLPVRGVSSNIKGQHHGPDLVLSERRANGQGALTGRQGEEHLHR
jgi:hypothetical protein